MLYSNCEKSLSGMFLVDIFINPPVASAGFSALPVLYTSRLSIILLGTASNENAFMSVSLLGVEALFSHTLL
ncbi:hypothetical protein SDC9_208254 [bioreactor metagenome]|uniref:Uncharacterized protein n=1 Tax=bioreactor metagenome TaxID=1076179 RepID=A0A645JAS6_9ZZZZ